MGESSDFAAHFKKLQESAQASAFSEQPKPQDPSIANVRAGSMALWRGRWVAVVALGNVPTPSGGSVNIAIIKEGQKDERPVFAAELKA